MTSIVLKNMVKDYPSFRLGPISAEIPQGVIVGLIGENGAGKSTLIKCLLGLKRIDQGSIEVLGEKMDRQTYSQYEKIAVVFDELPLAENLKISQVGRIAKDLYPSWQEEKFGLFCQRFALDPDKRVKELSRGMQMKLGLCLALCRDSDLLILDEPTGGLDPLVREDFLDDLLDFIQDEKKTVVISSHILSDLEKVADYIGFIHQGQLLYLDAKDELLDQHGLVSLSREDYRDLDKKKILGKKESAYGVTILVNLKDWSGDYEKPSLEDIMTYTIHGRGIQ